MNTLVNFESALLGLDGQFSVGGNKLQADLQKTLLQPEFMTMPNVALKRKHIISRMMEIAERNNDLIQFANE